MKQEQTVVDKEAEEERKEAAKAWDDRNYACGILAPQNPLRQTMRSIAFNPKFENGIMFFIMLNSICLAWDRPGITEGSIERAVLAYSGHCFNAVFSVEFVIKLIALGIFYGPEAYFKDSWNRLDGFIVLISWVDYTMMLAGLDGGSALKVP